MVMRWFLVLALVGCTQTDPIEPQVTSGAIRKQIPISVNRKLDVVFVIDNSPAMAPYLDNVRANLGRFITTLRNNGLPELRLGVVTTSVSDDGALRGTSGLAGTFVIDVVGPDGERVRNYDGELESVFARLSDVGTTGGTAAPLHAVRRAFENPANNNFLRENAFTAVFVISPSDDRAELVTDTEQFLKQLHADPTKVIVGGALGDTPQLHAFLDRFPNRSTRASIADPDWAAKVFALVQPIARTTLGSPCIEGPLLDLEVLTPGLQPACAVWYTFPSGGEVLRPCIDGLNGRCWEIVEDRARCPTEAGYVSIRQPRIDLPERTLLELECLTRRDD
jgi:hypothetical protein